MGDNSIVAPADGGRHPPAATAVAPGRSPSAVTLLHTASGTVMRPKRSRNRSSLPTFARTISTLLSATITLGGASPIREFLLGLGNIPTDHRHLHDAEGLDEADLREASDRRRSTERDLTLSLIHI